MTECHVSKQAELWHRQFGHLNMASLKELVSGKLIEEFNYHATEDDPPFVSHAAKKTPNSAAEEL